MGPRRARKATTGWHVSQLPDPATAGLPRPLFQGGKECSHHLTQSPQSHPSPTYGRGDAPGELVVHWLSKGGRSTP
jgi:hypothetical protein